MKVIHRIIQDAPQFLTANGYLLLEIGDKQADKVRNLVEQTGRFELQSTQYITDLAGKERILITKMVTTIKSR